MVMTMEEEEEENYEPLFRARYIADGEFWEEYDHSKQAWFRLCRHCKERVDESDESLCAFHKNKNKKVSKSRKVKRRTKKKKTKFDKKQNQQIDLDMEIDQLGIGSELSDESMGMIISISSALNTKQISQIKKFIQKFHTDSASIQLTCESQLSRIDDTTTHIIADDDGSFTCSLTKQIVQGCVRHIFIGSIRWIVSSLEQSILLDHFPFEILRSNQCPFISRGIKQCRFDQLPVFPSSSIISIECETGFRKLKISREEIIDIVELSGATLFDKQNHYSTLIILCNTKKEMFNIEKDFENNIDNSIIRYFCRPEFLFDSIVRHEIQAIEKYIW